MHESLVKAGWPEKIRNICKLYIELLNNNRISKLKHAGRTMSMLALLLKIAQILFLPSRPTPEVEMAGFAIYWNKADTFITVHSTHLS